MYNKKAQLTQGLRTTVPPMRMRLKFDNANFGENSNLGLLPFKVIDLGANQKRICNFLLGIYHVFPTPHLFEFCPAGKFGNRLASFDPPTSLKKFGQEAQLLLGDRATRKHAKDS